MVKHSFDSLSLISHHTDSFHISCILEPDHEKDVVKKFFSGYTLCVQVCREMEVGLKLN